MKLNKCVQCGLFFNHSLSDNVCAKCLISVLEFCAEGGRSAARAQMNMVLEEMRMVAWKHNLKVIGDITLVPDDPSLDGEVREPPELRTEEAKRR